MTESSGFWDGETIGDALPGSGVYGAPYDAETEFNRLFNRVLTSDGAGYVFPNMLNNLTVQASSPAAATVDVLTGGAYVKGFHYLNDATNVLTIGANAAGNPRLDRIVIRVEWSTKTVRLAVLAGTAAASPTLPALTQVYGTTWEISLAYIWVANGFATITGGEIHDERVFMQTAGGLAVSDLRGQNLILNSEFMAAGLLAAPERWATFGTIPTLAYATKYSGQPRGRAMQMTATTANDGVQQTFTVPASTMIAIKTVMNVTSGDVGEIVVTTNSASPGTITRTMRRTGSFVEETIYYLTEADASTMTIEEYCVNSTDVVQIGQTLAVIGYWPGLFRIIHEMIPLDRPAADTTNWFMTAAKSDGTTVVDVTAAAWGSKILIGTLAVYMIVAARDSGSAGVGFNLCLISVRSVPSQNLGTSDQGYTDNLVVRLGGHTNDQVQGNIGAWIPLDLTAGTLVVSVNATGAGTLDSELMITAIQT